MILVVSSSVEFFIDHTMRTVSIVPIGFLQQMREIGNSEALYTIGEAYSELLAKRCIENGYRVIVHDGLLKVGCE